MIGDHRGSPARDRVHVTLAEVSKLAGVSTATTSRVVNGIGVVSEELRNRVMAAVDYLEYTPNHVARSMASQRTMTLGLVVTDVTNPYFTAVARGVEDRGLESGYAVLLCNTDEDVEKERTYLNILRQRRVDGIILAPAENQAGHVKSLAATGTKLVLIDRHVPGLSVPSVEVDNVGAMRQATEYLLSLGHRNIGLIRGRSNVSTSDERLQGYALALEHAGLPLSTSLIANGDYTQDGGFQCGLLLLSRKPRPTAIISSNNVMTTGLLLALREAGMNIPEDVSLISFDDLPYFSLLQHPLTAISQPMYELGSRACELLLGLIDTSGPPNAEFGLRLPAKLIARESCAPPRDE